MPRGQNDLDGGRGRTPAGGDGARLEFSGGTLVLTGTSPFTSARVRQAGSFDWTLDPRIRGHRCDAIYYQAVHDTLTDSALIFDDAVPAWQSVTWGAIQLPRLRPEQVQAVEAWMQTRKGVIVMPTGTGKTEVALTIMRDLSVSTLIVAPVRDLMYQWHQRILDGLDGMRGSSAMDVISLALSR